MKWVRRIGAAVLGGAALLVAALAITAYWVDLDGLVERKKPEVLARLSEVVGQPVEVGQIDPHWFPTLGFDVRDVRIQDRATGPNSAKAQALLRMQRLSVGVAVWPALTSLGKDIQVTEILLEEPWLRLVQRPDGSYNISELGGAGSTPSGQDSKSPMDGSGPDVIGRVEGLSVGRVAVKSGHVVHVPADGPPFEVHPIEFSANDVALGAPLHATLEATAMGAVAKVEVETESLPRDLTQFAVPELKTLIVDVQGLSVPPDANAPAGSGPFAVHVEGRTSSEQGLVLDPVKLHMGTAILRGRGAVPMGGPGSMRLTLRGEGLSVASVASAWGIPLQLPEDAALTLRAQLEAPMDDFMSGRLRVERLGYRDGQSDLDASATVTSFSPLRFELEGRSEIFDVTPFMAASETSETSETEQSPRSTSPQDPILSGPLAKAAGTVRYRAERIEGAPVPVQALRVQGVLSEGTVRMKRFDFESLGGKIDGAGTEAHLAVSPPRIHLETKAQALATDSLISSLRPELPPVLTGDLNAQVSLQGQGVTADDFLSSLAGKLSFELDEGRLEGLDLVSSTAGPLRQALDFVSAQAPLELSGREPGSTEFRRLAGTVRIEDGTIRLKRPLSIDTDFGDVQVEGAFGLDQDLDLTGSFRMAPDLVRAVTRGRVRPNSPLPLGFQLGCAWTSPCVKNVDAGRAARTLAQQVVGAKVDDVRKKARKEIESRADAVQKKAEEEAKRLRDQAEDKAKEEVKDRFRNLFGP